MSKLLGEKMSTDTNIFKEAVQPVPIRVDLQMGKHSKASHHHKPAIERAVPIERIVQLFSSRFDDPYLNPSAELSFGDLTSGLPDLPKEELEEALTYWTGHSGDRVLSTKTVEEGQEDSRVWYVHGLSRLRVE
jgi:hypothetical protein